MTETLLILAVALAMDSVAVSIAIGAKYKRLLLSKILVVAGVFGFFQGLLTCPCEFGYLEDSSLMQLGSRDKPLCNYHAPSLLGQMFDVRVCLFLFRQA